MEKKGGQQRGTLKDCEINDKNLQVKQECGEQNISGLTAKEQRHKLLQIPTQWRVAIREKAASGDLQRRENTEQPLRQRTAKARVKNQSNNMGFKK